MKKLLTLAISVISLFLLLTFAANAAVVSSGDQNGNFTWTLTDDGTLTFNTVPYSGTDGKKTYQSTEVWSSNSNPAFFTWRKAIPEGYDVTNESLVKKIVISEGFECIAGQHNTNGHKAPLSSYENLETIELPSTLYRVHNKYISTGAFSNNPKLKTIITAGSANNAEGTANIEGINRFDNGDSFANLFKNCPLIEKVIFDTVLDTANSGTAFKAGMFSGCTALSELTVPAQITEINADFLSGCTSLKYLKIENSSVSIEGLTLPQNDGLVFDVSSTAQYDYVTANYPTATVNKISVTGQQIGTISGKGIYTWELFDGVLTFYRHPDNTSGTELKTTAANKGDSVNGYFTEFDTWKKTYGSSVKHVVISDEFKSVSGANAPLVFSNLPNCETINLGNVTKTYLNWNGTGLFEGNKALTTVYGNSVKAEAGTANISFITEMDGSGGNTVGDCYGGPNEMFRGCESIKKVILPAAKPKTNSRFPSFLPEHTFNGCTSLEEVVLPSYVTTIGTNAFADCSSLTTLQIENPDLDLSSCVSQIPNIAGLTVYCSEAQQAVIKANLPNVSVDYPVQRGEEPGYYSWILDHEGTLTFYLSPENTTAEIKTAGVGKGDLLCFNTWKPSYVSLVKKIVISDGITYIYGANAPTVLSGYPNLTEIDLGDVTGVHANWSGTGVFQGNTALTTVYGNSVERKENVVDISYIVKYGGSPSAYGPNGLFTDCTSITKIIFPTAMPKGDGNAMINYLGKDYFKGCTSLKEVVLPTYMESVKANAFAGCTALERLTFTNVNTVLEDSTAIPESASLLVLCGTAAQEAAVKAVCPNAVTDNYDPMVSHGFSIRLHSYNGLRSIFGFDTEKNTEVEALGLTLKEYGTILANRSEYEYWGQELTRVNGEYITRNTSVVKVNVLESGKYLSNVDDNEATLDFAVTVTSFRSNYDTDICTVAYTVYTDKDGNDLISYHYCGGEDEKKFISLYDLTVTLLKLNYENILSNEAVDEIAVWNTVLQGADTDIKNTAVPGFDGVTVTLANDTDGSKIAFVRSENAGNIPFSDAVEAALSLTSAYTVTSTVALGVNKSESIPANIEKLDYSSLALNVRTTQYPETPYKAAHVQGLCVDDKVEHVYFSLTGAIVKVRISDGVEVGKFVVSDEQDEYSFHAGDMAYYNGKVYTAITYSASKTDKMYLGVIDETAFDNGDFSDEALYGLYIGDIGMKLSNGENAFRQAGIDGITISNIPGKGYIDKDGNTVKDTKKYMAMEIANRTGEASRFDNDNKQICFLDLDKVNEENLLPLNADRIKGEEKAVLNFTYRMFVYTGYNRYGIQNLCFDDVTGDIILSCYDREEATEFPVSDKCTYVVDGSKMAYYGEIEVGQSSSSEEARANAELYKELDLDCDGIAGDNCMALTMTLKCICGKGDMEHHEAIAYGEAGYAAKICALDRLTTSFGIDCIGNGYFYRGERYTNDSADPAVHGGNATLVRLSRNVGAYTFLEP